MIAALGRNRVIGAGGQVPWHLPADLRYFKQTTMGKPLIMGRKTHESIGRPLPGRMNIVLTRKPDYRAPGCTIAHTIDQALDAASGAREVMVIGGGELYRQLLPRAERLYLTFVDAEVAGDTFFPPLDPDAWKKIDEVCNPADGENPIPYCFTVWERP